VAHVATARSCFLFLSLSRLSRSPGIVAEVPVVQAGGDEEHREAMWAEEKQWLLRKEGGKCVKLGSWAAY
jgi:hypothetical protein